MVTITEKTKSGSGKTSIGYRSAIAAVADTVELTGLDSSYTHCFLGVMLVDVNGDAVLAGAGTFAITVMTDVNNQYEAPPSSSIDGTAPTTIDWAGNTRQVKVVPTGITTAISYYVVLVMNRT